MALLSYAGVVPRLTLLDDPGWDGHPLPAGRVLDLLAVLVAAGPRGAADAELVDRLWDVPPAGGTKALQVVVTRSRSATGTDAVVRTSTGYRLGDGVEVDAWELRDTLATAVELLERSPAQVPPLLARSRPVGPSGGDSPLDEVRRRAAHQRADLEVAVGCAWSRLGHHTEALDLLDGRTLADERAVAALLRSVAAVHGTPAALDRFEAMRAELSERLGVDPSTGLRDVQAELLAADDPVRTGVEAPRTALLGRDGDLAEVRAALTTSRVVTVLGAGGLGKTTLAQTIARTATVPVVHVVPLVSVVDGADVVAAVADALGVRETVSERRDRSLAHTVMAGRIAVQLTGPPTLLVLDNCEQVVAAVADLVGHLVAAVPRLTVLATSRNPLQIAAERVVPLAALTTGSAMELFRSRAAAVRPGVELPAAAVQEIVTRLDGVPLAIELAAAQVRLRSVVEIAAGLDARFELLRGGLRDVPDRHRTLQAVIDWSWQLLDERAQWALGRLSAFRSPFGRVAAAAVLVDARTADDALDALVDHSLLLVVEIDGVVRFRMLETVREFGMQRLKATDDNGPAQDAIRDWAVDLVDRERPALGTAAEVSAVLRLIPELPELAEVLRRAVADSDLATVLALGHVLGELWIMRGDRTRVGSLVAVGLLVVERADEVTADQLDAARNTLAMAILAESFLAGESAVSVRECLARWGPGENPSTAASVRVALVPLDENRTPDLAELLELARGQDVETARLAWQWSTFILENLGDYDGAIEAAGNALRLLPPEAAASSVAMLKSVQAQLLTHLGRAEEATVVARQALSLFVELRSDEDAAEMQALLAMIDLAAGRLEPVRRAVASWPAEGLGGSTSGAILPRWVRAELAVRDGDIDGGLAGFLAVLADADSWFPLQEDDLGASPWSVGALMAATTAHARWKAEPEWLYTRSVATAQALLVKPRLDYPLLGSLVFGIVAWNLLVLEDFSEPVLVLLALSRRFGHGLTLPTWPYREAETLVAARHPELWAAVELRLATVEQAQLRAELVRVLAQLGNSHILRA